MLHKVRASNFMQIFAYHWVIVNRQVLAIFLVYPQVHSLKDVESEQVVLFAQLTNMSSYITVDVKSSKLTWSSWFEEVLRFLKTDSITVHEVVSLVILSMMSRDISTHVH